MGWKYSAVGVRALASALAGRPEAAEVLTRVMPSTRAALQAPSDSRWHDGAIVVDFTIVLDAVAGGDAVEALYFEHVRRSIGPLALPFVKVALSLSGKDPRTILSRMDGMMASVLQGVKTTWEERSARSGQLLIVHEDEVKLPSLRAWAGPIRYVFELCEVTGQVRPHVEGFDGHHLRYDLSWEPRVAGGPQSPA